MSKPSWDDAPEWAKYMAMDEDGAWYWYEDEPYPSILKEEWANDMKFERVAIADWRLTLESRP